jgi:hypothetical protein
VNDYILSKTIADPEIRARTLCRIRTSQVNLYASNGRFRAR